MTDNIHEMSRAIGSLESSVKTLTTTWAEQDREASEGRRILYGKVDELKSQQGTLTSRLAQLTDEFAEIKPAIRRFEIQRQRAEGASSLRKLIWTGIVTFAAGLGYVGHEFLIYLWPPRH